MIACLGWGSLIWDPRALPIKDKWCTDGPLLRVEFVRQSADDRLTLVLLPTGTEIRSLWTPLSVTGITEARKALAKREGLSERNYERFIGVWSKDHHRDTDPPTIRPWAHGLGLDAVVWTALPPRFRGEDGRVPTVEEAVEYIRALPHEGRRNAERYIRMTPRQVDTRYRRRFEVEFGWTPLDKGMNEVNRWI